MPVTFKLRELGVAARARHARGRGHPGRGPRAGGTVRRQGRRRDRPGADRGGGGRRARRLRRRPPHDAADEGLAGGARDVGRQDPQAGAERRRRARPRDRRRRARQRPHPHLQRRSRRSGMPAPAPPPENFVEILERVWWRLDRALDERALARERPALRRRGAARRAPRCSSTTTSRRTSSRARSTCSPTPARSSGCARCSATARPSATAGATRRGAASPSAAASCARTAGRWCAAASACTPRSPSRTRRSARPATLCRELGAVLHVHVAEDGADVDDARARGYAGPLERLHALGALVARLDPRARRPPRRRRRCARADGLRAAGSCRTRARTGATGSATRRRSRASGRVALGTDGYPADMERRSSTRSREVGADAGEPRARSTRACSAASDWRARCSPSAAAAAAAPPPAGDAAGFVARDARRARRAHRRRRPHRDRDGRLLTADIDALRAAAREEAPRLWRRMTRGGLCETDSGLETDIVDRDVYDRTVERFRDAAHRAADLRRARRPGAHPGGDPRRARRGRSRRARTRSTCSACTGTTTPRAAASRRCPSTSCCRASLTGVARADRRRARRPLPDDRARTRCSPPTAASRRAWSPASSIRPATARSGRRPATTAAAASPSRASSAAAASPSCRQGMSARALRLARPLGRRARATSSARPAPRATSRRSTTSAPSSTRDPANVDLQPVLRVRQLPRALPLHRRGARARRSSRAARSAARRSRLAAFVSATGSAGTLAAGDYLKEQLRRADRRGRGARVPDAALQRLRRAQHPGHRRQARAADPQRDEHRRRGRRLRRGHRRARRCSSTREAGRALSRASGAACRADADRRARLARPVEHLQRARARSRRRSYFDLGPDDVVRHRRHRRRRDVRQRVAAHRAPRLRAAASTRSAPARSSAQHLLGAATDHSLELGHRDRERIFNLGYYTWVEQQGVSLAEFTARARPGVLARPARPPAGVGRADRRVQPPRRRGVVTRR